MSLREQLEELIVANAILRKAIRRELVNDPHHKSYEGRMRVVIDIPDVFAEDQTPDFDIEVDCYVCGPGRHYSFSSVEDFKEAAFEWLEEASRQV